MEKCCGEPKRHKTGSGGVNPVAEYVACFICR
jgi:hypothetical protein